jgi:hypothetical protein
MNQASSGTRIAAAVGALLFTVGCGAEDPKEEVVVTADAVRCQGINWVCHRECQRGTCALIAGCPIPQQLIHRTLDLPITGLGSRDTTGRRAKT